MQSELGRGSTFTVTLELAEPAARVEKGDEFDGETITGYNGERRTILVVDDYAANRSVVQGLLRGGRKQGRPDAMIS